MNQQEARQFLRDVLSPTVPDLREMETITNWALKYNEWQRYDRNTGQIDYFYKCNRELTDETLAWWGRHVVVIYNSWRDLETKRAGHAALSAPSVQKSPAPAPKANETGVATAQPVEKKEEPRRVYDDETLTGMVLEFLHAHRLSEFTYNQVADDEQIRGDWKQVSKVLRQLERGEDVIEFHTKDKTGKTCKVYKFAPQRKLLTRDYSLDYSLAQELVGNAVVAFLSAKPHQSERRICRAMTDFFGVIDKGVVKNVVKNLHASGRLSMQNGPRNSHLFSIFVSGR